MIQQDVTASCYIDFDEEEETYLLYVTIMAEHLSMTLEFADITDKVNDYLNINDIYKLYEDEDDLLDDLEKAHFDRFLGRPENIEKIDTLSNLRIKMHHKNGTCGDDCIFCVPELGEDTFPDFTSKIRNTDYEGES